MASSPDTQYHIYVEGVNNRIVKDPTKTRILYRFVHRVALFSFPPTEVYCPDESDRHVATIEREGRFNPKFIITLHPSGEVIVINPATSVFSSDRLFTYKNKQYNWCSDKVLSEVGTKNTIGVFERRIWAITKKGVLTLSDAGIDMLDAVILSAVTMQYKEEESRKRNRRLAGSVGGLAGNAFGGVL